MFLSKYSEGVFLGILLLFSAGMFAYSFTIVGLSSTTDKLGPSFMPKIIFGVMTVLSVLILIDYRARLNLKNEEDSPAKDEEEKQKDRIARARGCIAIGGILVFVFLMDKLGFLLSSILYLFFEIYMLGPKEKRRPLLWAAMTIVFCVLVYWLFRYQVYVKLPKGILG